MRSSLLRSVALLFLVPAGAFCGTSVVNMSHYDMMRPDVGSMKSQGIIGVIHEATYPPFARDPKYLDRQMGALQAGLLWGAYHYANASDPIRQADHFLNVVSNAWAQANPATRPSAGVLLVLDFEKNGDRKSTRLNSSRVAISYAVFCLKKKKEKSRAAATSQM